MLIKIGADASIVGSPRQGKPRRSVHGCIYSVPTIEALDLIDSTENIADI